MTTGAGTEWKSDLTAGYLVAAVERSLRRLRTDYINLFQSHQDDPGTPQEETLAAYDQLVQAGKVRVIGASHFTAERLAAALAISEGSGQPRYETLQAAYSLSDRSSGLAPELLDLCAREEIGVLCYSALAKGFLSGKYRTPEDRAASQWADWLQRYDSERGHAILAALDTVADEMAASPASVSLAWLLAQPGVAAPIVAVNNLEELADVVAAPRLELSSEQLERLSRASAP